MPNEDAMSAGFSVAVFAWSLWWNIDWRRFIEFYTPGGTPYPRWGEIGLRIFFALCSLGAAADLRRRLFQTVQPHGFYRDVLVVAAAWFAAMILIVKTAELLASKRKKKS